jgi:hypothetical protein
MISPHFFDRSSIRLSIKNKIKQNMGDVLFNRKKGTSSQVYIILWCRAFEREQQQYTFFKQTYGFIIGRKEGKPKFFLKLK